MDLTRFHAVLSRDTVELLENKSGLDGIGHVALGDGDTDLEIVLVGILKTGVFWAAGAQQCHGGRQGKE